MDNIYRDVRNLLQFVIDKYKVRSVDDFNCEHHRKLASYETIGPFLTYVKHVDSIIMGHPYYANIPCGHGEMCMLPVVGLRNVANQQCEVLYGDVQWIVPLEEVFPRYDKI